MSNRKPRNSTSKGEQVPAPKDLPEAEGQLKSLMAETIKDAETMKATAVAHGKAVMEAGFPPKPPLKKQTKTVLQEAVETIQFLRGEINDVTLLNCKLLYTEKLFQEFSGLLTEHFKMKIVESFDLITNVREVKMVYMVFAETLNFVKSTRSRPVK